MTQYRMKNAALSAIALAALTCGGAAQAATDYLLKIEGVPGESKVAGSGPGGAPHVRKGEKWIELDSVQYAVVSPRDVATGQATGKRAQQPAGGGSGREASTPSLSEKTGVPGNEETAAMLLPAVQKVREAAARMTPWTGCAVGQKIDSIAIKQKSTGKEGTILDATVTACATESLSFNFSKIEWK